MRDVAFAIGSIVGPSAIRWHSPVMAASYLAAALLLIAIRERGSTASAPIGAG